MVEFLSSRVQNRVICEIKMDLEVIVIEAMTEIIVLSHHVVLNVSVQKLFGLKKMRESKV